MQIKQGSQSQSIILNSVPTAQNNYRPLQRNEQQLGLIRQLIADNKLFIDYRLSNDIIQEIGKKIILLWSESAHIASINDNEIYLLLEGNCFQYTKKVTHINVNPMKKANEEFIMVRKLQINEYFVVYGPNNRYKHQNYKKYQLMVDEKTLLAKISDESFARYLLPLIDQRYRNISHFFKKVQLFSSLPQIVFYELSKYLQEVNVEANSTILGKGVKSQYVFFIKDGQVQLKKHFNQAKPETTPNANYQVSHTTSHLSIKLKRYAIFGMEFMKGGDPDMKGEQQDEGLSLSMSLGIEKSGNSQYSAQSTTKTSLYKIDKRMLAIVVTSFEEDFRRKTKVWSSVDLNSQIQGQAYQSPQRKLLIQNAEKIRTAERKVRDLKLRYMTASKTHNRNEGFVDKMDSRVVESREDQEYLTSGFKSRSTSNMNPTRYSVGFGSQQKSRTSFQPYGTTMSQWENLFKSNLKQAPKLSTVQMSAYNEHLYYNPPVQENSVSSIFTARPSLPPGRIYSRNDNTVKLESDIIRNYLDNRTKNQLLTRSELVKQKKNILDTYSTKNRKRIYSNYTRNSCRKQEQLGNKQQSEKQLGLQLYQRMNKLDEHPLLSRIQSQRKRLEVRTRHVQTRTKSQSPRKKISKGDQMILIRNHQ